METFERYFTAWCVDSEDASSAGWYVYNYDDHFSKLLYGPLAGPFPSEDEADGWADTQLAGADPHAERRELHSY